MHSASKSIGDLELQLSFLGTDPAALEQTIIDLQAGNAVLEAQIAALGGADQTLAAEIATNNATIVALQEELGGLADLEGRIEDNRQMIAIIEGRIVELEADLAIKQNIVNGTCNPGFALVAIQADGGVLCEEILHPEPVAPGQLLVRSIQVGRSTGFTGANGFSTLRIFCNTDELAVNSGYTSVNGRSNVVGSFTNGRKAEINFNQPTSGSDGWTQLASCARIAP